VERTLVLGVQVVECGWPCSDLPTTRDIGQHIGDFHQNQYFFISKSYLINEQPVWPNLKI
jgi:hypothetical protein